MPSGSATCGAATSAVKPDVKALGPRPRAAVRTELARALVEAACVPFHALIYLARHRGAVRELREELARPPARVIERVLDERALAAWRASRRELSIFVSCAEASGETHAVSFVRALRAEAAALGLTPPRFVGLGGARLAAEGVELVGNPVERAVMGLKGVTKSLSFYLDLLEGCAARVRSSHVDVCVPVDSPALHVPLARLVRRYGVPTVHFVAPQYWGWAPWRTRGYRKAIARALTILPFEPAWFERRGVNTAHVGHPLLDALEGVPATRARSDERALVLLPGSRTSVIERNLPWMLALVRDVHARLGAPPIVVAHEDAARAELLERLAAPYSALPLRFSYGALHDELGRARSVLSVSGTVLLDVLHHRTPSVVVYRLGGAREEWMGRHFLTAPWFAAINLLAGSEVVPEFAFHGEGGATRESAAEALVRCHADERWREDCIAGLERAAQRLGPPGAARRAAREVLDVALRSGAA